MRRLLRNIISSLGSQSPWVQVLLLLVLAAAVLAILEFFGFKIMHPLSTSPP